MTTPMPINLDKLRNAVQKFGGMSFTTSQVAADYYQGESTFGDHRTYEAQLAQYQQQRSSDVFAQQAPRIQAAAQ